MFAKLNKEASFTGPVEFALEAPQTVAHSTLNFLSDHCHPSRPMPAWLIIGDLGYSGEMSWKELACRIYSEVLPLCDGRFCDIFEEDEFTVELRQFYRSSKHMSTRLQLKLDDYLPYVPTKMEKKLARKDAEREHRVMDKLHKDKYCKYLVAKGRELSDPGVYK